MSSLAAIAAAIPASAKAAVETVDAGPRCRVTVLRRECFSDLQSRYLDEPESGPCPVFATGQQFDLTEANVERLITEGKFCPKAWECIRGHVRDVMAGKTSCDTRAAAGDPNIAIACCNDGTRPVVFKIERVSQ